MERQLHKSLIRLILILIATILLVGAVLFYSTLQGVFLRQMKTSNDSLAGQVASSFELVMEQIRDQIYKFGADNNELNHYLRQQELQKTASISLYRAMDSIILGNKYLYSIYLYAPDSNQIFSSDRGASYAPDKFFDQAVLPHLEEDRTSFMVPRMIPTPQGGSLLLSTIVLPLPVRGNQPPCTLLVNINMQKLYDDILKNTPVTSSHEVYIYDDDGNIVISRDQELLYHSIGDVRSPEVRQDIFYWLGGAFGQNQVLQSDTYSQQLGWHFYLRTSIPLNADNLFDRYLWVAGIACFLIATIVITYYIIRVSTHPLKDVMDALNEKILHDILTDTASDSETALEQLQSIDKEFKYERFLVALVEVVAGEGVLASIQEANDALLGQYRELSVRLTAIRHNTVAMILNFEESVQRERIQGYLRQVHDHVKGLYDKPAYLFAGSPRNSPSQLASSYQACIELQNRKLVMGGSIAFYQEAGRLDGVVEYPSHIERQLLNNLMVGNEAGCLTYEDKFFDFLFRPDSGITDLQIRSYVYQMQNAILKKITSLPISVRVSSEASIETMYSQTEIREWFADFLRGILVEITRKNAADESVLIENIFAYIGEKLLSDDFNLNSLSYQFNLNRNYLAKLIKEHTGYSFNEYANREKVRIARELLADSSLTVEAIARQTGFRYTHYFIKIFKGIEGITPGQYRELRGSAADDKKEMMAL